MSPYIDRVVPTKNAINDLQSSVFVALEDNGGGVDRRIGRVQSGDGFWIRIIRGS
jgi:hypothetical protein